MITSTAFANQIRKLRKRGRVQLIEAIDDTLQELQRNPHANDGLYPPENRLLSKNVWVDGFESRYRILFEIDEHEIILRDLWEVHLM